MKPLISVIVPVYKVEEYLPKCIDTIRNQTYHNLEIILVDDGSPDNCGALCDHYAELDSRIRVIHQKNGGISAARNAGLDVMRGELLIFVDADDWLVLNAVEYLYDRMVQDGSDMVIGQMVKIYDDGHTQPSYCSWMQDMRITGQEALSMLGTQTPIPCYAWGKLMKKNVHRNLRYDHLHRGEDVWILPHILDSCQTISLDSRMSYFYYQRASSIVHSSYDVQFLDSAAAEFHVAKFLMERGLRMNSAVHGESGMRQLLQVRDAVKARKMLTDSFVRKQWWYLGKYRPRCILYAFAVCAPRLRKAVRKLCNVSFIKE